MGREGRSGKISERDRGSLSEVSGEVTRAVTEMS